MSAGACIYCCTASLAQQEMSSGNVTAVSEVLGFPELLETTKASVLSALGWKCLEIGGEV